MSKQSVAKSRVVFDTNTFISALILPRSITKQALDLAIEHFELVTSEATWIEFETRIAKGSLERYFDTPQIRESLVAAVNAAITHVSVHSVVSDCRDADDNKFLALALDSNAKLIVTGDKDLLTLHPWRGVDIVSPGDFVRSHAAF
jgi:uncharacterized protein